MEGDPVGGPVAVPGDDRRALAGVGGRQLLDGEKAARGLAGRPGQLREVRLGGGDDDIRLAGSLRPGPWPQRAAEQGMATRLCTVWKDCRASRSLPREDAARARSQAHRDVGVLAEGGLRMSWPRIATAPISVDRLDGRRAALVVEHPGAEDVTGAEVGQGYRAPVGVLADGATMAGADDVARVGGVALAEDDLAPTERARHRDLRDARQFVAAEDLENRYLAKEADDVLREFPLLTTNITGRSH